MAGSQHPTAAALTDPKEGVPSYRPGAVRGTLVARFGAGVEVPVDTGRARAYPGLRTEAPSMLAFYEAFAELAPSGHVLDVGSGSSLGARCLALKGFSVTALEQDADAVAFASHYAPGVEHVQAELCEYSPARRFGGAVVADLFAHTTDPEAAVMALAGLLEPGALCLFAEPAAHVSQRLSPPQRRGFSLARLRALLVRAGFTVEAVLCDRMPFIALLARAESPNVRDAFVEAYAAAARGDLSAALTPLDRANDSGRPEVELEILLARAELYLAQGLGDASAEACFRARELAPSDARALTFLSRIALASGATNDALLLALDAVERDPSEPAACALAALCADGLGHDSLETWRAASNLAPDDAALACELARAASRHGDHALALHCLERVERYGPPDASYHVTRAWLLLAAGLKAEASIESRIAQARGADPSELAELIAALHH